MKSGDIKNLETASPKTHGESRRFPVKVITRTQTKQEVQEECRKWAEEIKTVFKPDLIVFIAKSGFLFAQPMQKVFECPMVEVIASRPKSNSKDKMKKIIKLLPDKLLLKILSSPVMYKFHEKNSYREVALSKNFKEEVKQENNHILIVDDSVDTGWTLLEVKREMERCFPVAQIKTAAYSVIDYSKKRVKVDFYRWSNQVILTATSRKSVEYENFLMDYEDWRNREKAE